MPRRKPKVKEPLKMSKEEALKKKQELEDLIFNDDILDELGMPDIPPIKPLRIVNLDNIKMEVEIESRAILSSLVKFYIDAEITPMNDYINYRTKIDSLSLSTMAYGMRTAQHAITKLMDEINTGGGQYQARNFEVLAQLQDKLMQMPGKIQVYLGEMEKAYRNINKEMKTADNENQGIITDNNGNPVTMPGISGQGGSVKIRGNKTLMENLQNVIKTEVIIKEAQIVPDKSLVDPKTKDLITPANELSHQSNENSKVELDEDLF